jgi:hypothetical protein
MFEVGYVIYSEDQNNYILKVKPDTWLPMLTDGGAAKFRAEIVGDLQEAKEVVRQARRRKTRPSAAQQRLINDCKKALFIAIQHQVQERKLLRGECTITV